MVAVSAHVSDIRRGVLDFGSFLREHDPQVIIVDLPPPYDRSWLMFQHLRTIESARRSALRADQHQSIQGCGGGSAGPAGARSHRQAYDLQNIVEAVRQAIK